MSQKTLQDGTVVTMDVNTVTFEKDVLEESHKRPVVVDFWAPWCGPCRVLGPILEGLAEEHDGRWLLAKLNTDDNQHLSSEFGIRGIPAVKAFYKGQIVDEFVGALPKAQVQQWLERFIPGEADDKASAAEQAFVAGNLEDAKAYFQEALAAKPKMGRALLGLAGIAIIEKDPDTAETMLEQLPFEDQDALEQELAAMRLQISSLRGGGLEAAQRDASEHSDDPEAQVRLGKALAASGQHEEALSTLLAVIQKQRSGPGEEARQAMIEIFGVLGMRHPLSEKFRAELAQILHS